MKADQILSQAQDTITVKRVFGEPYEKNGVTVITAAGVLGGGGAGSGEAPGDQGEGSGGGFGVIARPVGAFVIKGDQVSWQPAIDVNRAILGGQILAVIALLTLRTVVRILARR
ncbi:MAG: sporulation protein [Chloroflexi bacterium]|nr:MAG: sporulation protein [Chloroflexota bacterium]TMF22258.1 MAG: sporulation protein [Chloroflexota bacterium]TMG00109.1 MAG: sporulation protein [Chloroflexota bacterium]